MIKVIDQGDNWEVYMVFVDFLSWREIFVSRFNILITYLSIHIPHLLFTD